MLFDLLNNLDPFADKDTKLRRQLTKEQAAHQTRLESLIWEITADEIVDPEEAGDLIRHLQEQIPIGAEDDLTKWNETVSDAISRIMKDNEDPERSYENLVNSASVFTGLLEPVGKAFLTIIENYKPWQYGKEESDSVISSDAALDEEDTLPNSADWEYEVDEDIRIRKKTIDLKSGKIEVVYKTVWRQEDTEERKLSDYIREKKLEDSFRRVNDGENEDYFNLKSGKEDSGRIFEWKISKKDFPDLNF